MASARRQATLDRAHLADQTGGDTDLARELLHLFEAQCTSLVPVVLSGTVREQAVASHTLKGASLAVGAFAVAVAADAIEARAVGQEAGPLAGDLVEALCRAVGDVRRELAVTEG